MFSSLYGLFDLLAHYWSCILELAKRCDAALETTSTSVIACLRGEEGEGMQHRMNMRHRMFVMRRRGRDAPPSFFHLSIMPHPSNWQPLCIQFSFLQYSVSQLCNFSDWGLCDFMHESPRYAQSHATSPLFVLLQCSYQFHQRSFL